jgi:TatD DNase family protein
VRRGVNAYFSFGNALRLNHKHARAACAAVERGRLLFETDAPYQGGRAASAYTDLAAIREEAALLRGTAAAELEIQADAAFSEVFGI